MACCRDRARGRSQEKEGRRPTRLHLREGHAEQPHAQDHADADALFSLLEREVGPLFMERNEDDVSYGWSERVRSCLRQLVSFFNTHRMLAQYLDSTYLPAHEHTVRSFREEIAASA